MKINKSIISLYLLMFCILFNCKNEKKIETVEEIVEVEKTILEPENVIEVITRAMDFSSPDTIPSGWNTFKYFNLSNETHFFLLDKYPEGKTIENTIKEVGPPFDKGMELINQGKPEEGYAEFAKLPEWFSEVIFSGGSGLIGPKNSSVTTVKLDPGYYIMECYVKMPNGKFHTSMGMAKVIIVTEKDSGNQPPEADIDITIARNEGITYSGLLNGGSHVFSVTFKDQSAHEHFVGHDVNLVKLSDNADLNQLEKWMNWSTPFGLKTPVPEGVAFLGGVNDSPTGAVGYFKATLSKGKYAFISEVPNSKSKGMFKVFEVTD